MKYKVIVTLKPGVLDPQGQAIQRSLAKMGHHVASVRQGKYFELELDPSNGESSAEEAHRIAERILSNPVIEAFRIEEEQ